MPRRRTTILAWVLSLGLHAGLAYFLVRDDVGGFRTLPTSEPEATVESPAFEFTMGIERSTDGPAPATAVAGPPATGRKPVEFPQSNPMSAEMSRLVRDLGNRPAERVAVRDVEPVNSGPVAPRLEYSGPAAERPDYLQPVEFRAPAASAKPSFGAGRPVHGPLGEGKSVVYLLDRSTSMGLPRENFDAARAALLASVDSLPANTNVQIFGYNGRVVRVHGGKDFAKAGAETTARLERALGEWNPEGESRHEVALRAALALNADCVVWITDATDDELDKLKPILKGHPRPVSVSVARVNSGRAEALKPLR